MCITCSGCEPPTIYQNTIILDNHTLVILSISSPPLVEQAVVYSTLPQEYSTLTFRGEVLLGGDGVEERSEVMYCIEGRTYIYYKEA